MRILIIVIIGMVFATCRGWAQEDNVVSAASSLQGVLSGLVDSVQRLGLKNDQLNDRDNELKQQIMQLQAQLEHLQAQEDLLNKESGRLGEHNPGRAQKIADLEEENIGLENQIHKIQTDIKAVRHSLTLGYQEEQKGLLKLKDSQNSTPVDVPTPQSQANFHRQKEKLKLMKMIYDSQQRQETLHDSIMDFQKNTPLLPAASALAHQQLLKEQIKDLEDQMAAYQTEKSGLREQSSGFQGDRAFWDDTQLGELELELRSLEDNYSQLKVLMEQMTKKSQKVNRTISQHVEEDKLQSSVDDLGHQSVSLRADLDDLRTQMVDLDKRKTRLEEMIHQQP